MPISAILIFRYQEWAAPHLGQGKGANGPTSNLGSMFFVADGMASEQARR
jgi:hypothetical protein